MTIDKQRAALEASRLVKQAQGGDRAAFSELVRRYRSRIVALALHLTGSEQEAEDIAQEVFIKAYQRLSTFEGRSHFFTWVYRIAVNRSHNARRDLARHRTASMDDPRVLRAVAIDAKGDPAKTTELKERYGRLVSALDRLPAPMRTSVVLVILQGLSHAEAGIVQGCRTGTIAWRIHDARRRLADEMTAAEKADRLHKPKLRAISNELGNALAQWLLPVPRLS